MSPSANPVTKRQRAIANPKIPQKPKKPSLVIAIGIGKPKKMPKSPTKNLK